LKAQTFCLVLAVATLLLSGARSVSASVSSVNFIGAFYKGNDSFYGKSVVAYKTGSNVTVAVSAYNDYLLQLHNSQYLRRQNLVRLGHKLHFRRSRHRQSFSTGTVPVARVHDYVKASNRCIQHGYAFLHGVRRTCERNERYCPHHRHLDIPRQRFCSLFR